MFVVVILLAAFAAAAGVVYSRVDAPFRGYSGQEQFIEIPPGAGPAVIGQRLVDAGIVRDRLTWRIALFQSGSARELKAGEYRFDVPLSPRQVIARLVKGDVYLRPITFPEGLTIAEMAQIFQSHGFGSAADFVRPRPTSSLVKAIDPDARDLEGYLFPDTYACRATHPRRSWSRNGRPFQAGVRRRPAAAAARAESEGPRSRDPGVDRREGDRASRKSGRWSRPSI